MDEQEQRQDAVLERIARDPVGAGDAWISAKMGQTDEESFEDAVDVALGVDPQEAKEAGAREAEAREREVRKRFG